MKHSSQKEIPGSKLALAGGSYSLGLSAVLLAILIVLNVLVGQLPAAWTNLDISSTKLYSVTSNTKAVVNTLQKDVTIYWIVQADQEDKVLTNLLSRYESLSGRIRVVKKNPDTYPTFAQQYTKTAVENNSLVVTCGDRYRYIAYSEIYLTSADMYSYSYTTSFDGEGAITSAIDYVTREVFPVVYTLQGHGEAELPATFAEQITKANMEIRSLSLLTADAVPSDAAAVLIYAPQSDISQEEQTMLLDYTTADGKLLVMAGPVEGKALTNLYGILESYGVSAAEGIVVETDRNYYAFQRPYILIPDMADTDVTASLNSAGYYTIMPLAMGLTVEYSYGAVTELLTTSTTAYSKASGFSMETYDWEEGDVSGQFALAVSIDSGYSGRIIWFACSNFLEDMYNAYSSGANTDLAMNAMASLVGESEAMAIRSKSLNYNYLTISQSQGNYLKMLLIGVIPGVCLLSGILVLVYTRRKQSEAFDEID